MGNSSVSVSRCGRRMGAVVLDLAGNCRDFSARYEARQFCVGFLALPKRWGWDIPSPSEVSGVLVDHQTSV